MHIKKLYAPIRFEHSAETFWTIYRASTCAVERRRAQFFALLAEGRPEHEVLDITRYAVTSARSLIQRYHTLGLAGVRDGRHANPGAPTVLTAGEQQRVAARLHTDFEQGIVWEGKDLQAWIKQEFGKDVYLSRTYEFMRAAGFSPQKPRPHHVKGDPALQDAFKATS